MDISKPPHITNVKLGIHLAHSDKLRFRDLHNWYDETCDPVIGAYNDASGRVGANINMAL